MHKVVAFSTLQGLVEHHKGDIYQEALECIRKELKEVQKPYVKQLKSEIAALADELEDFNSHRVAPYGRITEIAAKMRQLSAV